MFEVLTPGLMSTIQDVGRNNYLSQGFAPSGAFDNFSLRIGNLMLGNKVGGPYLVGDNGEAGIEITLGGLVLRVLKETAIAITGADVSPTLNDVPVPMWKTTL
ncbi:MAG: KipI antagonist, partial [Nitrososphaeria archaeon]|nr:KipI antagonist [Nitrososphaeria archaeon]NIQ34174.1 KipI antagonist [Nitrososphaeria archaeon]